MASVVRDPGGRKRILFVGPDRKRKAIRLGKVSQKVADAVNVKVESLVSAGVTGHLDNETAAWVAALGDVMADYHARRSR